MRTLIVVLIAGIVAVGCASAPTEDNAAFNERFTAMQIQSGAKFPTAPVYKSTRKIARADE
jgi:hypothetical protein